MSARSSHLLTGPVANLDEVRLDAHAVSSVVAFALPQQDYLELSSITSYNLWSDSNVNRIP